MTRVPRRRSESILTWQRLLAIIGIGGLMAAVCLIVFATQLPASHATEHSESMQSADAQLDYARTLVFSVLALSQLFYVASLRSFRHSVFRLGILSNYRLYGAILLGTVLQLLILCVPVLSRLFRVSTLTAFDLMLIVGCAAIPFVVVELGKALNIQEALSPIQRASDG